MTLIAPLLALALAQEPASAEEAHLTVEDHLKKLDVYAISDGSSVYSFHQDHTFELEPLGLSGRTIDGVWSTVDGGLLVTGQWKWINGPSLPDDYREMLIQVIPHPGEPTEAGMRKVTVQPAYATIEKVRKVDASVYKRRKSTLAP